MPEANVKLPMIPLRGIIAFPTTAVTFDVGRDKSVNAIEHAMEGDRKLFFRCAARRGQTTPRT